MEEHLAFSTFPAHDFLLLVCLPPAVVACPHRLIPCEPDTKNPKAYHLSDSVSEYVKAPTSRTDSFV